MEKQLEEGTLGVPMLQEDAMKSVLGALVPGIATLGTLGVYIKYQLRTRAGQKKLQSLLGEHILTLCNAGAFFSKAEVDDQVEMYKNQVTKKDREITKFQEFEQERKELEQKKNDASNAEKEAAKGKIQELMAEAAKISEKDRTEAYDSAMNVIERAEASKIPSKSNPAVNAYMRYLTVSGLIPKGERVRALKNPIIYIDKLVKTLQVSIEFNAKVHGVGGANYRDWGYDDYKKWMKGVVDENKYESVCNSFDKAYSRAQPEWYNQQPQQWLGLQQQQQQQQQQQPQLLDLDGDTIMGFS